MAKLSIYLYLKFQCIHATSIMCSRLLDIDRCKIPNLKHVKDIDYDTVM